MVRCPQPVTDERVPHTPAIPELLRVDAQHAVIFGVAQQNLPDNRDDVFQVEHVETLHTESGCILTCMSEKRNSQQESESSRLEGLYRKASDVVVRTHLLMVWRISEGDSVEEVARMVGYSGKWVREIKRRYESGGVQALGDRRHGNPGAKERALLDEAGEEELLEALLSGSPPGGGMWNGPKVARWIKERNGLKKVHVQRGFEYLRKVWV